MYFNISIKKKKKKKKKKEKKKGTIPDTLSFSFIFYIRHNTKFYTLLAMISYQAILHSGELQVLWEWYMENRNYKMESNLYPWIIDFKISLKKSF